MNLEETKNLVSKMFDCSWVKWLHDGTKPANNNFERTLNAVVGTILPIHCARCLNLNGCCFVKTKAPAIPLHEKCHCKLIDITLITPKITCPIEKFTKYIFDGSKSKGKKELFESWGYSIIDSENLVREFTRLAKLKYQCGEYSLGNLDAYGQRISIIITLPKKNGMGEVSFVSGWMVYPNGEIVLTTPYGGK